jgi:hypothetical protein
MIRVNLEPRISMSPVYIQQGMDAVIRQTRTFDVEGQPPDIKTRLHIVDSAGNDCAAFEEGVWTYWMLELPDEPYDEA